MYRYYDGKDCISLRCDGMEQRELGQKFEAKGELHVLSVLKGRKRLMKFSTNSKRSTSIAFPAHNCIYGLG